MTRESHAKALGISVEVLDKLLKMAEEHPDLNWHIGRLLAEVRSSRSTP